MDQEELAGILYQRYCNSISGGVYCKKVGGLAYKGERLPTWKELLEDEDKTQADAWKGVASAATIMIKRSLQPDSNLVDKRQKAALGASRLAELEPYRAVVSQIAEWLADLDEDQWQTFLAGAKTRHAEHLEALSEKED